MIPLSGWLLSEIKTIRVCVVESFVASTFHLTLPRAVYEQDTVTANVTLCDNLCSRMRDVEHARDSGLADMPQLGVAYEHHHPFKLDELLETVRTTSLQEKIAQAKRIVTG